MNPKQKFERLHNQSDFQYQTADFNSAELERVETVCDKFENDWKSGRPVDIESCVSDFDGQLKSLLFAELLSLDIHYRSCLGQTPAKVDYETRFPEQSTVIESVFRSCKRATNNGHQSKRQNRVELTDLSFTNRYQLEQFHARGGLGVIYEARDTEFGRQVAVKLPRNNIDDATANIRLEREAQITGRLEHPGIVSVYATGHHPNGSRCYVMQMIEGETLQAVINRLNDHEIKNGIRIDFQSSEFRQLLQRFIAVCQTVSYAHSQQVIHRDIKPSNIILGQFGATFLLDWGLARIIDGNCDESKPANVGPVEFKSKFNETEYQLTSHGQCMGTPGFASPEQMSGDVSLHHFWSDIYSLGATLHCLLSGLAPADGERSDDDSPTTSNIVKRPREFEPTQPRQLNSICNKAMALSPSSRYATVEELVNDLERYLADEPVSVMREPRITKTKRWCRKHPRWTAGIAATLLVAMSSFAVSSYLLGQKNKELIKTSESRELAQLETMSALRTMSGEVIEHWVARQESLTVENRAFIESILTKYESFANLQTNQAVAFDIRAEGYYRVGLLNRMLGRDQKAIEVLQVGIDLAKAQPSKTVAGQTLVARMQGELGDLLSDQMNYEDAEPHLLASLESVKGIEMANNQSTDLIRTKSSIMRSLGELYWSQDRHADAVEACRQSRNTIAAIEDSKRDEDISLQKEYAGASHDLAVSLNYAGKNKEASRHLKTSLAQHRAIVAKSNQVHYRIDLGKVCLMSGKVSLELGEFQLAENHINEAIGMFSKVTDEFPALSEPMFLLASSHSQKASLRLLQRRKDDVISCCLLAKKCFDQGVERSQIGTAIPVRYLRQNYHLHGAGLELAGKFDEAAIQFEKALQIADDQFTLSTRFSNREHLVSILHKMCSLLHRQNKWFDAQPFAQRMFDLIDEIEGTNRARLFKSEVSALLLLGYSLTFQAEMEQAAKQWMQLENLVRRRSVENSKGEDLFVTAQVMRALCIARSRPEEALEVLEPNLEIENLTTTQIYNMAGAAGMASQYLDRKLQVDRAEEIAISQLERALKAGHFFNQAQIKRFKGNPSFRTMHQNEAFKEITQRIVSSISESE